MNFFASVPWCASLLNDPSTIIFTPPQRLTNQPKGSSVPNTRLPRSKDHLFGYTLNTADTIPHSLCFYRYPTDSSASDGCDADASASANAALLGHSVSTAGPRFVRSCTTLHALSSHGLSGFPRIVHGGLICAILDEAMGVLVELNQVLRGCSATGAVIEETHAPDVLADLRARMSRASEGRGGGHGRVGNMDGKLPVGGVGSDAEFGIWGTYLVTMTLTTKFRCPVKAGQLILVEASVLQLWEEKRRVRIQAQIRDHAGRVLAECDSLWAGVPRSSTKL